MNPTYVGPRKSLIQLDLKQNCDNCPPFPASLHHQIRFSQRKSLFHNCLEPWFNILNFNYSLLSMCFKSFVRCEQAFHHYYASANFFRSYGEQKLGPHTDRDKRKSIENEYKMLIILSYQVLFAWVLFNASTKVLRKYRDCWIRNHSWVYMVHLNKGGLWDIIISIRIVEFLEPSERFQGLKNQVIHTFITTKQDIFVNLIVHFWKSLHSSQIYVVGPCDYWYMMLPNFFILHKCRNTL